jgi:ubiquinone/menaquinone biosynthesis C-methylase UbiE
MPRPRVNYDLIAHLYDKGPHRAKSVDPELLAFMAQSDVSDDLSILDIGCGTGNQLVANRTTKPRGLFVGLDRSREMLRQAQPKSQDIAWLQADGAMLPFRSQSFDFVTCQHALHHLRHKASMLQSVFRVLRPGGRLVIYTVLPQESKDWLYYEYFPEAYPVDLGDFWPAESIIATMRAAGFGTVMAYRKHVHYEQNMQEWLNAVRRRDITSQLMVISDAAYAAGLRRLEEGLADGSIPPTRTDHLCLVTIRGERPADTRARSTY